MLLLFGGVTGAWAQPNTNPTQIVCPGTQQYWADPPDGNAGSTYTWTITPAVPFTFTNVLFTNRIDVVWPNPGAVPATYTIEVQESAGGCPGPIQSVVVTVNPTPDVIDPADQIVCNGALTNAVNFTGNVPGTVFNWTNDNTAIGLVASGTGNIAAFNAINLTNAPITANITVTPSFTNGGVTCTGTPQTFSITVNPTTTVDAVADAAYCNGATTAAIAFTSPVAGTTFTWTNSNVAIGLGANGIGNLPSFTATNPGVAPISGTITVTPSANGCTGTPITFTITVNPTTTVAAVADAAYCNGATTAAIAFTSPVAGTTFTWTNSNVAIGLGANGIGNLPSFTATNPGVAPISGTITVTPSANGCTGTPITFTITVNPTTTVDAVADAAYCNGATTAAIAFTSPVAGTTFTWTNSNVAIGLGANGIGNLPSFTATNPGVAPISGTITVTPSANGCTGTPITFTITVNPTTTVDAVADAAYCNGATTAAIAFTSPVAGTTFTWTNSNVAIGLGANGIGNLPSFTATNPGVAPISGTITVTPSANGCTGTPITFTITVNPTTTVDAVADAAYCNGATTAAIAFTSPVAGTTFTWTNSNVAIGLGANGIGNLPSFTATNPGVAPISGTITVTPSANGCTGTPITFTITVNPTTTVDAVADAAYCNGATTAAIAFTSPVAGTTFTWTNSNVAIGLGANGIGNLPSFTATNPGVAPISGTITVTPSANGCTGTPITFTITVNPTTTVDAVADAAYCNGATTAAIAFTSPVAGTTFTWTNSNVAIGLGANGIGNLPSFTATNPGAVPIVATITVTPSANGCAGTPITFTITVNPTTTVDPIADAVYCNGTATAAVTFTSPIAGTTFTWTNSNIVIGLGANGIGNLPSFTATNPGVAPISGTITVTPSANGCAGTPETFTITVTPTPATSPIWHN